MKTNNRAEKNLLRNKLNTEAKQKSSNKHKSDNLSCTKKYANPKLRSLVASKHRKNAIINSL